jgi:hypothetical protein
MNPLPMTYASPMRTPLALALALLMSLLATAANARAFDARQLARYDVSYVKCEAQYPEMKGHGDEAYLNLWRMKPDDRTRGELAKLRSSAAYREEKERALRASAKAAAPAASSPLTRECIGLWAEFQRNAKPKR